MSDQTEPRLWADWSKHYERLGIDPSRISRDGRIDVMAYDHAPVRVVFALKEVRGEGGWSLLDHLQGGPKGKGTMWHAVARWAAGIHRGFPPYSEVDQPATKRDALHASAVVNLKKTGGGSQADMAVINSYALRDRELLSRQIRALKPDVVLACGTFNSLAWVLDLPVAPDHPKAPTQDSKDGFWVVPWRHPGRADAKRTYALLKETVAPFLGPAT